ncbi:phosphate/phosphite/phosphonate ABC transporter substrate-binding protein [Paenibacillus psychroresistens]|uniref:Phosphate/phosphite/phosphonate ABC transporter substrate-binding protein n=1 Tax=Paenibacillus psychroresistens TaxID=1778678 RepID=A0A6B8RH87_9BACL|nr:phosphate/phosphite/phosphonate ABC transporter substrate-binding protein [Paenibacillus psychroresistens]QGQ94756.1 phosphate/phosphite/phosphonate ABC transporter substrate-binding protein [Paenibacillus psychroresistens]
MKKVGYLVLVVMLFSVFAACSNSAKESKTITIGWLPNESGEDIKSAREEIGKLVEKATGKKVEHKTTTDYIIAIESVANGNVDIAYLGAQGYIEAKNKNKKVEPLVIPSGKSGTAKDAVYYSWIAVKKGNEAPYMDGDKFKLDNIAGKKFSFVSNSSTSGFKVPSDGIVTYFNKQDKYKDLKKDDLLEGGSSNFFSEVLYGGSHQGSAVNLLADKVDAAAFCDTCVSNYVGLESGTDNRPGAVYKVKDDAAEPFDTVKGGEFSLISVTPVLNAPFVVNTDKVSADTIKKLVDAFTSAETTANQNIFVSKESGKKGIFAKTDKEAFVVVDDAFFNPVRELSN